MPRPFGGKCTKRPSLNFDPANLAPRLAITLAALVLALTISTSPILAASDDEPDTGIIDENGSDANGGTGTSAPSKASGTASGTGGLTVEGLVYWRKDLPTVPFTKRGGAAATPFVEFDSSELDGETYTPGLRISLQGAILNQPIEVSAFFVDPMGVEATKLNMGSETGNPADTDMIYNNAPGSDFSSTNSDNIFGLTVHHETKLYGGEVNLVRPFGIPGVVFGARTIYFGEELSSTAAQDLDDFPGLGTDNDRDHATIRTDNRLLGLQLGLQHMFDVGDVMRIGGSIKGGLYNNFVDRNRTFVSENRPDLRSFETTDHDNVFAQGVEVNPRVEFKLAEGTYLTASGQFLWLNNVSTALPHYASVSDLDGDHDVRANDDIYFYGGSLGLTIALNESSPISNSLTPFAPIISDSEMPTADIGDIEARIAELEETSARKGNEKVSFSVSGWINRMFLAWDDGAKKDVYVVDNTASRSRINFNGAAKIARGWSAGYLLSLGFDDAAANDVNQFITDDDSGIAVRHSAWWIRNNQLGTVTLGLTSTATDNIILKDVGGIMPGAANIATIGGSLIVRHADWYEQGNGALVRSASGIVDTTLNDFSAGASVDTLRRNIIRYDAPRISGLWGNVDLSAAWGEDDFVDFAVEHSINYNDWKFRFGAGYLHDTSEGRIVDGHPEFFRDREEYKGSASLLHIPTGLFATAAYVHRTFHGLEEFQAAGTPGTVFGENTAGLVTPPGTNRPPIDYLYTASGLRRQYWAIGDTSVYGEYAQVDDAITGLHEADLAEVTDSRLMMVGAAICQDIDDAGMDVYAGFRYFQFDTQGVQNRSTTGPTGPSPVPLTDLVLGYAGTRIKF